MSLLRLAFSLLYRHRGGLCRPVQKPHTRDDVYEMKNHSQPKWLMWLMLVISALEGRSREALPQVRGQLASHFYRLLPPKKNTDWAHAPPPAEISTLAILPHTWTLLHDQVPQTLKQPCNHVTTQPCNRHLTHYLSPHQDFAHHWLTQLCGRAASFAGDR